MSKKLEEIPPFSLQFAKMLEKRSSDLETLIKNKEKALSSAPEGSVRIVKRGKKLQFYKKSGTGDYQGTYLSRKDDALALALVQKDYDEALFKNARLELYHVNQLATFLSGKHSCAAAYEDLDSARKKLVTPVTLTDEQYAQAWQALPYRKKKMAPSAAPLITENGEQVRSKSELIIANALKNSGIPYRYEFPLGMCTNSTAFSEDFCHFYPDFYCLNVKTRAEFAWEHFGMMDNPEYAVTAVQKLAVYAQNGFYPGINLIITMETKEKPLNSQELSGIINAYLK